MPASTAVDAAFVSLAERVGRFETPFECLKATRGAGFDSATRYLAEERSSGAPGAVAAFADAIAVERHRRLGAPASPLLGHAQEAFGAVSRLQLTAFQRAHYPWELARTSSPAIPAAFLDVLQSLIAPGLAQAGLDRARQAKGPHHWRLSGSVAGSPVAVEFKRTRMNSFALAWLHLREWDIHLPLSDPFFFSWVEFPCSPTHAPRQLSSFWNDFAVVWPHIRAIVSAHAGSTAA